MMGAGDPEAQIAQTGAKMDRNEVRGVVAPSQSLQDGCAASLSVLRTGADWAFGARGWEA